MKTVGLKFLLEMGTFIMAIMGEGDAKGIIQRWVDGLLPPDGVIGSINGYPWAVRVSAIQGMHVVPSEDLQKAGILPPDGPRAVPGKYTSGIGI